MEGEGGASIIDLLARSGTRQSVFRSYVFPWMDRPNLTVLPHAVVTRITFEGKRATGVEISYNGGAHRIRAWIDVVLSLGAIQTPKVLMQSGIGDQGELRRFGIPVVQHLPGVGRNFQDHTRLGCVWEYSEVVAPLASPENAATFGLPASGWTFFGSVVRPKSRGRIALTGPNPLDPVQIDANFLSHPDDLKAAIACVELSREIGNSVPLRQFIKREVMPGNLKGTELENFIRDAVMSYFHETCTAKMGRDAMSVVDGNLKVYGVDNLRIADGSIMPRVTTGNTMAPCVIIGERAAEVLRAEHKL
jgi:choline dehydrogenase